MHGCSPVSNSVGVLEAMSLASRRLEDSLGLGLEGQVLGLGLGLGPVSSGLDSESELVRVDSME